MRTKLTLVALGLLCIAVMFSLAAASATGPYSVFSKPAGDDTPFREINQTCETGSLFGQEPYDPAANWNFYTSDTGPTDGPFLVYDNFSGAAGADAIRFWGIRAYNDGTGFTPCSEDPMTFDIIFYADAAGTPGPSIATYTAVLSGTATGVFYAGSFELYEYETTLVPAPPLGAGTQWVSIQASGDATCWFLWSNSPDGDLSAYQWDGSTLNQLNDDLAFCLMGSACTWNPGDPHKMHYPQLPDPAGWDVNGTDSIVLADDWRCSETGPVTDFHWWGSWRDGIVAPINAFTLRVFSDIPADQSPTGYSMPGDLLWEYQVDSWDEVAFDPPTPEGWYDPTIEDVRPNNHQQYFQYNVCIPEPVAFVQQVGTIYWFSVSALVSTPSAQWGWKSTLDHFNDDAVWAYNFQFDWTDIWEPTTPITNDYFVSFNENGDFVNGGGSDFYGDGWYEYPSGWWNIWFYDHPFTYDNKKTIHLEFDLLPFQPGLPTDVIFAVNWATDQWSLDQPPADSLPPLPGQDETLYIGREILFSGSEAQGHYIFDFEIPDYNPEWVSIDVQGFNFQLNGFIAHACRPSLDLAFVVTGQTSEPTGACCFLEPPANQPLCVVTTQTDCEQNLGGTYLGDGTTCATPEACCLPDGQCVMVDPVCCEVLFQGTPQGAGSQCSTIDRYCCLPDGVCELLDPLCCEDLGGTPLPAGVVCTGITVACCFADGSCQTLDEACCETLGGTPSPTGATSCLGDANGNMIDDACEAPRGACCYDDATGIFGLCIETTQDSCLNFYLGSYSGDGTTCLGTEACCFQDGSCLTIDALCCEQIGGMPQGTGTSCLGDLNGNMIDDACEAQEVPGACCLEDGSCLIMLQTDCLAAGGDFKGGGTVCGGDANNNGIDDICENWEPGDDHKMHYPQLPDETGWDVKAFAPHVLADDWQCSESGPVSDIHFWGSWLHGLTGNILGFWISIHADIPASQSSTGYSMPGQLLWLEFFQNYNAIPIDTDTTEGWYDPSVVPPFFIPNDHSQYVQYNIFVDSTRWFYQEEGTIYWLNISAILEDTVDTKWGWKSSIEHFNDDAVSGIDEAFCVQPDNGSGTVDLPPDCPYTSDGTIDIVEGLPAGTTIEGTPTLHSPNNIQRSPGGSLGGEIEVFTEILQLELQGTGSLPTFSRNIQIPVQIEVHTGPRTPGDAVQDFETEMVQLQGELFGDPDFDLLRISGGTGNGLPSPGHTTLTRLPGGNFNVDSFFDIEYRIEFQGAPGSVLEEYGGVTQRTIRVTAGGEKVDFWNELYEPPLFQQSLDLSFVITGGAVCDCIPGDADGNGIINISDAVYLISYIFGGGPAPKPYATCSGDADCNCIVNISDAVYLITYIFGGGPAPCDCQTWLSNCGPPLY